MLRVISGTNYNSGIVLKWYSEDTHFFNMSWSSSFLCFVLMSPLTGGEPFEDVNNGAAVPVPLCHQANVSISFFTKDSAHKSQHFLCLNKEYFQSS